MVLPYLRFYGGRLYNTQRTSFLLVIVSAVGAILSAGFYFQQRQLLVDAQRELQSMRKAAFDAKLSTTDNRQALKPAHQLPVFDSVELVQALNEVAVETRVPAVDVGYSLDSSEASPYLRYRITLKLSAEYTAIRNFGMQLIAALPNVSMDSISCTRADTATVPLACELAFSAFYQRGKRG